jgi:hypothetical protein
VPPEFALKPVARETVTLTSAAAPGTAAYHGATFADDHFCLCAVGLFSSLAGFATADMLGGCVGVAGTDLSLPRWVPVEA